MSNEATSVEGTTLNVDVLESIPDRKKAAMFLAELLAEAGEETQNSEIPDERGDSWYGVLGIEGHPTSDRRVLMAGEIDDRDLPLPINVQILTGEGGHVNSKNAGRIESIEHIPFSEFEDDLKAEFKLLDKDIRDSAVVIYAEGTFDTSEWADEAMRQLENGAGISLDLPTDRQAVLDPETLEEIDTSEMEPEQIFELMFGDYLTGYAGKVGGATIVGVAAFEEATIKVVGDRVLVASAFGIKVRPKARALTAAAGPIKASSDWFQNPNFTELTPWTVTKDGRVFGHLADWDGCHIGFQGVCVPPFRSASGFAYFNNQEYETAEGDLIPVGKVMFSRDGVGHAPTDDPSMTWEDVQRHYDDATCVGAYVHAGSDRWGTWIAGCLRSDLTDLEIQHMRTHGPSGDWRPIKPHDRDAELIASIAVPIQGFPIARRALVASANGEITAIITAPLALDPDYGWRKRKRKKVMLTQRLVAALGAKPSSRARMRKKIMKEREESAA